MEVNLKKLPKTIEELEKIILLQQQEIESHKNKITLQQQEIISYKEHYVRLLEEFKLEKSRFYSSSSEKNVLQAGLFDEPDIELDAELKDQLDDLIDIQSYKRKKHPVKDQYLPIFLVKSLFMILVMKKKYADADRYLSVLEKRSVSKSNIYLQP